jgi:hypothetical protein
MRLRGNASRAYPFNNTPLQSADRAVQTCVFCKWNLAYVQISSHHAQMSIGMVQAWVAHFVTHKKYVQRV